MPISDYRTYGLNKGVSNEVAEAMTTKFKSHYTRKKRQGVFLGIDFLRELVEELEEGGYDGMIVKFGINKPPGTSAANQTYELVARGLKLRGGNSTRTAEGGEGPYSSSLGVPSTSPPDVGTPPIDAPAE